MSKGRLFIISGPSGCGKDTVMAEVFKAEPDLRFSISTITRQMRDGEVEGGKYHFIARDEFESLLAQDAFLEHNIYLDNYYGTPRGPVEQAIRDGADILVEVDVNGARQIREKIPDAVSVFILPPSLAVLRKRLSGRGTENAESLEQRLNEAIREIKCAKEYDYAVVNDDLPVAVQDFLAILRSDRCRFDRLNALISEMI